MALNPAGTLQGQSRLPPTRVIEPEEEESRRPKSRPVYQQTLTAWTPYLTPWKVFISYLLIGLLFIPLGVFLGVDSSDVVEYR